MSTSVDLPGVPAGEGEQYLIEVARQLRADSIRCSTAAGSGHPASAMTAADQMGGLLARHPG